VKPRAFIYVDGFNLYHRKLQGTVHRWLNPMLLCAALVQDCSIEGTRYFTAQTSARPGHPYAPAKQQIYFRALRTIPNLTIHLGQFKTRPRSMPLASNPSQCVTVLRTDEKGSDVNLATALLVDGWKDRYDTAVVVSKDTDLRAPIAAVRDELGKKVIVVLPMSNGGQGLLPADSFRHIRATHLQAAQFPETLTDAIGIFRRPRGWGV